MIKVHIISDLHLGLGHNDPQAVDAYCAFSRNNRPDHRVWLGDVVELAACNSRGAECELEPELEASRAQIRALIKSARPARHGEHWVSGNHEHRYKRALSQFLPSMVNGLPSLDQLLGIKDLGFDSFTPFKDVLVMDGVGYTHGTYAGKNHATTMLDKFPEYSMVYGHTHKPQTAQAPQFSTKAGRFAMGIGCLRTLDPSWAPGPTQWTSGFGVIHIDEEVISPYSVIMQAGRFIGPDGRKYA